MAEKTSIEWTRSPDGTPGATWNPVRGCTRVSEGCRHCYAERVAARFSGRGQPYAGLARVAALPDGSREARWTGGLTFGHNLDQPLRWRRPRCIFVNSMSDLFHEGLGREEIATVFGVCIAAHHLRGHVLQILTKRSSRMREILHDPEFWDQANAEAGAHVIDGTDPLKRRSDDARATLDEYGPDNPPPGIWLGVSAEDQRRADERIPDLLATPAAVRWVSAEPLISSLDFRWALSHPIEIAAGFLARGQFAPGLETLRPLDWVVVGSESGTSARPCDVAWVRLIRDQCSAANVPFFWKQHVENGRKIILPQLDGRTWADFPRSMSAP